MVDLTVEKMVAEKAWTTGLPWAPLMAVAKAVRWETMMVLPRVERWVPFVVAMSAGWLAP